MKNFFSYVVICSLFCFFVAGCGHSITHTDRGTGVVARIPLPDGSSLLDLKVGKIDSTTTILRGGTTYDSTTSTGGTFFGSIGTSERIQVSATPQFNEGNVREVLISSDCDPVTKQMVLQYLIEQKAPVPQPSSTTTIGASAATGKDAAAVKPAATGVDNLINKVGEAVPVVAKATTDTISEVSNTTGATVSSVGDTIKSAISNLSKIAIIAIITAIIVLVLALIVFFRLRRKAKKTTSGTSGEERQDENEDVLMDVQTFESLSENQ